MKEKFDGTRYQEKVITPEGEAMWCSLATPKQWKNEDKKNFLVSIILSKEDAQPIIDKAEGILEAIVADMPKKPRMAPHSPWEELEDGRVKLKFKKPAFDVNPRLGYPATPPIATYLPDGQQVDWKTADYEVGNGSTIKVGGFLRPYYVPASGLGITFRLDAVKVLHLEKYTDTGSSAFESDFGGGTTKKTDTGTSAEDTVSAADF